MGWKTGLASSQEAGKKPGVEHPAPHPHPVPVEMGPRCSGFCPFPPSLLMGNPGVRAPTPVLAALSLEQGEDPDIWAQNTRSATPRATSRGEGGDPTGWGQIRGAGAKAGAGIKEGGSNTQNSCCSRG